jgi:serpin B
MVMTNPKPLSAMFSSLLFLVACTGENVAPPGEEVRSKLARTAVTALPESTAKVVEGNATFALDLYRRIGSAKGNIAFSPYSVTQALSTVYAGANGETQKAFEQTLRTGVEEATYHRVMNAIDAELGKRPGAAEKEKLKLSTINQLFLDRAAKPQSAFLDVMSQEYGAAVRLMKFSTEPEPSRVEINAWVAARTNDLIKELIPSGVIDNNTLMALVNTVYFKGAWAKPFNAKDTRAQDFTTSDMNKTQVPMMLASKVPVRHAMLPDVEVVDVPYAGEQLSMLILAPPAGKLSAFESTLDGVKLSQYVAATQDALALLKMPRFEARTQVRLDEVLKQAGLSVAFSDRADLSGMLETPGARLTAVVHEAVVKVSEEGTEAAAATVVGVGTVSVPVLVTIDLNRPFVYAIRDRVTGLLLFVGRVENPAGQ